MDDNSHPAEEDEDITNYATFVQRNNYKALPTSVSTIKYQVPKHQKTLSQSTFATASISNDSGVIPMNH
jgi:hypothetical protein